MKLHSLNTKSDDIDDETMVLCDGHVERLAKNDNTRTVDFVFSSNKQDRMGDIVEQNWNLAHFKRNPIILFNHNPNLPIAKCSKVGITDGKLCGTVEFPVKGLNALSDQVYDLIQAGILNAGSVGFISTEREVMRDKDGMWIGMTFKKPQLLEFSVVSIPANSDALITARSMGLATDPILSGLGDLRGLSLEKGEAAKVALDNLNVQPVIRAARILDDGRNVSAYDDEGIFMGHINFGRLVATKGYQSRLAERNIAIIEANEARKIAIAPPAAIATKELPVVNMAARQHQEQRLVNMKRHLN